MAGSEGSGQTDLLSGWSCVVHRPSEDPEPSELPSTVDMAAFSSGLSVEPTQNTNNEDSCDSDSDSDSDSNNSGSDVSGSCSQSDSSDSESSSSSPESSSRSSSPEFSVMSSQTNGLRLKIATVRKSCASPVEKTKTFADTKFCDKPLQSAQTKVSSLSSSSDSPGSSSSSESESQPVNKTDVNVLSEKSNSEKKPFVKVQTAVLEKKTEMRPIKINAIIKPSKTKVRSKRAQKVSSSKCSSSSSSDSEDCSGSDRTMLASCSLQEIRQEDLAAILPDQQECDTFGGFDCRADKSSPQTGDGSGSDMELPQQAVNALIQRTTESSSESESRVPLNPNTLYANSLLQQFVAQTQLLNVPASTTQLNSKSTVGVPTPTQADHTNVKIDIENAKRKRGRPRKANTNSAQVSLNTDKSESVKSALNLEYCANPNVSPDSGIQNCSDNVSSPEPSPIPNLKSKRAQEIEQYSLNKTTEIDSIKTKNNVITNVNKSKEQRKLPVTSNSFDRVLYGNTDRVLYPPRRKVGRPPTVPRKGPGRPPKHKLPSSAATFGVSLKSNLSNEIDSNSKPNKDVSEVKIEKPKNKFFNHANAIQGITRKESNENKSKNVQKKTKAGLLHEICEKVGKRLDISIRGSQKVNSQETKYDKASKAQNVFKKCSNSRVVLGNKNKLETTKSKYTTLKNYKVMHSKHKGKKHKKCKFKILKPITTTLHDPKLNAEIDKLVADFVKFCNITSSKISKENVPEMLKALKKASKKRKASDYSERKKKKQNVNSTINKEPNSNEQRLPLKKRHYHLASDVTPQPSETDGDLKSKCTNSVKDVKLTSISNKNVVEKVKNVNKSISPVYTATSTKTIEDSITENNTINCSTVKVTNVANDCVVKIPKSKAVGTHIDEAIEACITKYSSLPADAQSFEITQSSKVCLDSPTKQSIPDISSSTITTTTPKKRHRLQPKGCSPERINVNEAQTTELDGNINSIQDDMKFTKSKNAALENVVSEIKAKKHLSTKLGNINCKKQEKKNELVSQVITRKKNRLEDLTLTLANKVNSSLTEDACETSIKRKKDFIKVDELSTENCKRKKALVSDSFIDNTQRLKKVTTGCVEIDAVQKNKKEITKIECPSETNHKQKKDCLPDSLSNMGSPQIALEDDNFRKLKKENSKSEESGIDKHKKDAQVLETLSRASVIKSPISRKIKPTDHDKLDCVMTDKPTGIFMPTIDIELHIPASKIQTTRTTDKQVSDVQERKPKVEIPCVHIENLQIKDAYKRLNESECKRITDATEMSSRKKARKRRPINRTGFPTLKKKKKKSALDSKISSEVTLQKPQDVQREICDRVPQEGEKYSSFLQRTEKLNVSNVLLEKLQKANTTAHCNATESDVKIMSTSEDEKSESRQAIQLKEELVEGTADGASDLDLKTDISDDKDTDLDELSLEARLELMNQNSGKVNYKWGNRSSRNIFKCDKGILQKRRLRDVSPSSSVDTFIEKKVREDNFGSSDESKRSKRVPRWRKKFLPAGLFSDYFKEDDLLRQKRAEVISKSKITYNPQEHPYGLLPPPYHCGKYLRCRRLPFQLPYDLWWQHTNSQLPGRDIVPSWNYRKIRTNVYNVKTVVGACEPQSCNCTSASQCGDDCINRLVLAECPAFHKCNNQKIQKHEWSPGLEKFMTIDKGWGIRTKLPIKSGEFILEYVGEVVADHEFKERMALRYAHDIHHYCLHLDGGFVIDGHRMGGDGRFVNHSCEPNCEMQKWSVNGQFRMALFALRDIEADEEITYDYNFSLFNPAEGQECKCGSTNCRGVIGGKSQRVRHSISSTHSSISNDKTGRVGRPRKNQAKRSTSGPRELPVAPVPTPVVPTPLMKPMSVPQKLYVREHHCFLLRNLNRGKHNRERSLCNLPQINSCNPGDHNPTAFMNHLNALRQPRNMRTRRLAQAEEDPKLKKMAQLASILKDFLKAITTAKDEKNDLLCAPFLNLPSKRKLPEYYQRITDPIDVTTIEHNVATGVYHSVENFDTDMNKVFVNAVRFFGRTSEPGIAATRLKKIYFDMKQESLSKLEEIIGKKLPSNFIPSKRKNEEEDVIRCICGMYKDEGLMIQCERCLVWQHCECVRADVNAESYHCEVCIPRLVDYEISLDEFTEHGHRYYLTLLRGDLQLRQGDTVYMLRDIPIFGTDRKHTYETIGEIKYTDLDIFRIERLWKDSKTGQRFAYGHHYLRPHETFHEPTRKFFPNEVMRVPLYEAVPVELVISHCWVMDLNTYCKGRPVGAPEEHIYICEYRVDKSARLFSKISKAKYPICTKTYAFDRFDVKLKMSRTYTPHDLDPAFVKPRGRKPVESDEARELQKLPVHVPVLRTPLEKKVRLNKLLLTLLSKMPTKQALDVSYLLEGGRRRKKQLDK